jgi:hypothetical protein
MKTKLTVRIQNAFLMLAVAAFAPTAYAQLTIPYADGSDGPLNITSSTVIDLSQAATGYWTNTSANPGNGTYDATQWAVVFKYSSVNIASGAVVTFINHPTHAPVVWLVSGNVTNNGELNLDGQTGTSGSSVAGPMEPGPGGFRGGAYSSVFGYGSGFGPGGGGVQGVGVYIDYPYGTTNITPLIGGSGSSADIYDSAGSGGGGAILIASGGQITVNGYCHANGGGNPTLVAGGSGGALRLVANQILGSGLLAALGGNSGWPAGNGRIRLEANSVANGITVNPSTVGVAPANPPVIFPTTNAPTVTVLSVAGLAAPADPKAIMSPNTGADDLAIAATSAVTIQLQTMNFPTNGTVNVYIKPLYSAQSILPAAFVSGNTNQAIWQVSTVLPYPTASQGHTVIQARAVAP